MALPKLGIPTYNLTLLSGEEIKFRPFLVKEEKALLIAAESEDPKMVVDAIRQTISNCLISDNKVDVDEMPMYELEWILLNIRMKSVGETSKFVVTCKKCKEKNPTSINLEKCEVTNKENTGMKKIMLTDDVGIVVKHIPYKVLNNKNFLDTPVEKSSTAIFDFILDSIESIFDKNQVYKKDTFSRDELKDFVDSMSQDQLLKIVDYIQNPPKIRYNLEIKCRSCEDVMNRTLEGISDFF